MRLQRLGVAVALLAVILVVGCSTVLVRPTPQARVELNIVSIGNTYVETSSELPVHPIISNVRAFNHAIASVKLHRAQLTSVISDSLSLVDIMKIAERYDSPGSTTLLFISSHGFRDGFLFKKPIPFEDLFLSLDREMRGTVILVLESCYSGVMNEVLAKSGSTHVFALTSTRGPELERWYALNGSFNDAIANAIRAKDSMKHHGVITFGEFYDSVQADICRWNKRYPLNGEPLMDAGMYGPRELVVLDSD